MTVDTLVGWANRWLLWERVCNCYPISWSDSGPSLGRVPRLCADRSSTQTKFYTTTSTLRGMFLTLLRFWMSFRRVILKMSDDFEKKKLQKRSIINVLPFDSWSPCLICGLFCVCVCVCNCNKLDQYVDHQEIRRMWGLWINFIFWFFGFWSSSREDWLVIWPSMGFVCSGYAFFCPLLMIQLQPNLNHPLTRFYFVIVHWEGRVIPMPILHFAPRWRLKTNNLFMLTYTAPSPAWCLYLDSGFILATWQQL